MGITLTSQQLDDLFDEAEQQPPQMSHQRLETIYSVPAEIGSGAIRSIELCEGLSLNILDLKECLEEGCHIQYLEEKI